MKKNKCDYSKKLLKELSSINILDPNAHLGSEIWRKCICGNDEMFAEISTYGNLRRSDNHEAIEGGYIDPDGYIRIMLPGPKKMHFLRVHRLVAEAFIPNPENKLEVNHKNDIKTDNRVENLEWVTRQENIDHAISMGFSALRGEENGNSKFTEEDVRKVCVLLEEGMRPKLIADKLGVTIGVITAIKGRKIWTHVSKDYNFKTDNLRIGENNNHSKYSNETIHKICKLLAEGVLYNRDIAKQVDVPRSFVDSIFHRKIRRDISDQYEFPPKKPRERDIITDMTLEYADRGLSTHEIANRILEYIDIDRNKLISAISFVKSHYSSKTALGKAV